MDLISFFFYHNDYLAILMSLKEGYRFILFIKRRHFVKEWLSNSRAGQLVGHDID